MTHKKFECPKIKGYLPLHVGKKGKDDIGYKKIYMGWNKEAYISKIAEQFREYVIKNINQW